MPRFVLHVSALALALAGPVWAAESVSKDQVLEAIRTFDQYAGGVVSGSRPAEEKNDAVAKASNTILKFTLESDDVIVDLGRDSVPWCDIKKGISQLSNSGERGLLLAAYLAGCVKAQLHSGSPDPNPYAGWVSMLRVYRSDKMRAGLVIPEVDGLLARQMDGTLQSFAATAVERSNENLRKKYGPVEGPQKQMVNASSP